MRILLRVIINTAVVYLCLYGYFNGPLTMMHPIRFGSDILDLYPFFYGFPSVLTLLALRGVHRWLNRRTKEPLLPGAGFLVAFLGVFFFLISFLSFYQKLIDKTKFLAGLDSWLKIEVAIILLVFIPFFAAIDWCRRRFFKKEGMGRELQGRTGPLQKDDPSQEDDPSHRNLGRIGEE